MRVRDNTNRLQLIRHRHTQFLFIFLIKLHLIRLVHQHLQDHLLRYKFIICFLRKLLLFLQCRKTPKVHRQCLLRQESFNSRCLLKLLLLFILHLLSLFNCLLLILLLYLILLVFVDFFCEFVKLSPQPTRIPPLKQIRLVPHLHQSLMNPTLKHMTKRRHARIVDADQGPQDQSVVFGRHGV